jgi:hypothetical protein
MSTFPKGIMRRVFGPGDTPGDLARLPAVYRNAGGGLMSRIAAAGILRFALRWPVFTMILIFSMVAARVIMSGRRHERAEIPPLPRAL